MSAKGIGRGCFGDLVNLLQTGLQQQGYYTGAVDGDFGGGTERSVQAFQGSLRAQQTGCADPSTWQQATGLDWPPVFERCLQLTARIEGHGYQTVAGDFDGAGLTWASSASPSSTAKSRHSCARRCCAIRTWCAARSALRPTN